MINIYKVKSYKKSKQTNKNIENSSPLKKSVKEKPLYNPKWFIIISMVFSFLPALILYSINYGRLGLGKKRGKALLNGIILFIVIIFMLLMNIIPFNLYIILYIGCNVGFGSYMNKTQAELYKMHIKAGGTGASFLFPIITSIVIIAMLIAAMIYSINIPFTKMTFHGDELYYTKNVNKLEVEKLGNYLYNNNFFKDDKVTISVKLDKSPAGYIFSFPANREALGDNKIIQYSKILCHDISTNVFNGKKVVINLCDEAFHNLKTVEE